MKDLTSVEATVVVGDSLLREVENTVVYVVFKSADFNAMDDSRYLYVIKREVTGDRCLVVFESVRAVADYFGDALAGPRKEILVASNLSNVFMNISVDYGLGLAVVGEGDKVRVSDATDVEAFCRGMKSPSELINAAFEEDEDGTD